RSRPHRTGLRRRGGGAADSQRRALRPGWLRLDQGRGPRPPLRAGPRGGHGVGQLPQRAPPAHPVRRHEGQRHRPRRWRLQLRLLHGDPEHRHRPGGAPDPPVGQLGGSMPARTGGQFLEGLKRNPPNIYIDGERVEDPTTHPATASIARSIAELYDLQHQPELVDVMTYESPSSGERVGLSFMETTTREDLTRRSEMHKVWADHSLGFIGRSPDYLNVNLMAAARAQSYFERCDPRFGENVRRYYEHVRENDLCLTHALTN